MSCGKQVQIELEGKETELDKAVIAAIKDPLTHLVRNAVDHGIEAPAIRQARGKAEEGRLSLRAFHEGGQVHIEIHDDGGGIDVAQLKHKALERGLITRDQGDRMSDRELLHLIFLPGFSTADKITNVSGRGVGMDVVKTNVDKIGGIIDVQSQLGQGTTIKIKIPLTLAIIPALIVTTGGDCYAIPQFSLLELVRLEGKQAGRSIEKIHTTPVYRLRGELIPLVYLDQELKVQGTRSTADGDTVHIAVLQADNRPFGLVVDSILGTEEIVVKPLTRRLKRIPLFAGATMRGDGGVALILDVPGLAQCAGVISEVRNRPEAEKEVKPAESRQLRQTLLLLGLGPEHRLAIPLSQVTRLEKIPVSAVEKTARQEVVQYRGQILPLIRLAPFINGQVPGAPPERELLQVVVYSERGRSVGLVVDRILDTVETVVELRDCGKRPGILGSAVIQERVTDLLDLPSILQAAEASARGARGGRSGKELANACPRQFCTFFLDEFFFGVEVEKVQEVLRYQEMTRVPLAPPTVRGLINLRGQIITALDLRRCLQLSEAPADQLPMNVVVQDHEGGTSLLVDRIGDVLQVDEEAFERPPGTLQGVARELVRGAYKLEDRLLLVLDTDKLVKGNDHR